MKLFGKSSRKLYPKLLLFTIFAGLVVSMVYTIDTTPNKPFYDSLDDSFIKKDDKSQISVRSASWRMADKSNQNDEAQNDVPFTSQAPLAVWDERDEEACEEATVLMAAQYFGKSKIKSEKLKLNPGEVDQELNKIIAWEKQNIGEWKSTTAEQTAKVVRDYYHLKAEVKDYNLSEIKQALSQDQLVIVPAAGRKLGNPYFKQPGPLYHMLLIKGYTKDNKIITNDPGTKRGADYKYEPKILENAAGDWSTQSGVEGNNGDVDNKRKVMIVVGK